MVARESFLRYYRVMFGYLEGVVIDTGARTLTLQVGGVGYRIFSTEEILAKTRGGKEKISLWTHFAVRENSQDLFGFLEKGDRDFFELLITVPGIGPKSALAVMNVASPATVSTAVATNDLGYLTKVSGIGRKTAEKIILELKGKIGGTGETLSEDGDVLEALKSLGYNERDIREVLKKIPETTANTGERVREALKHLGKK